MPASRHNSFVKAFDPSSCAAARLGPKALYARSREIVDDAGNQRRLRADNHEADPHRAAELHDGGMIRDVQHHVGAELGRARDSRAR